MAQTDHTGPDPQPHDKPDVDALLETLPRSAPQPPLPQAENDRPHRPGGRAWGSSIELADEYELDIRDCSCNEMNR